MDNDFFDIHVSHTSRHASTAKEIVEEVEKQLDYKVYRIIGIVEVLNNSITKPTTRYEIYKYTVYLRNLENKWLEVNGKYLTPDEKAAITNMYLNLVKNLNTEKNSIKKENPLGITYINMIILLYSLNNY